MHRLIIIPGSITTSVTLVLDIPENTFLSSIIFIVRMLHPMSSYSNQVVASIPGGGGWLIHHMG